MRMHSGCESGGRRRLGIAISTPHIYNLYRFLYEFIQRQRKEWNKNTKRPNAWMLYERTTRRKTQLI
jgi:hypothetical protein